MTEPAVPRPAATIVLLREGAPGVEVLLLERSHRVSFVPGAHVFPGGAVDTDDHDTAHDPHILGHDDRSASALQGLPAGGRANFVAAVRECIEEVGVLLATTPDGSWLRPDHPAVEAVPALRDQIETGALSIPALCHRFDIVLQLEPVRYLSRWITPEASPRRYDTRFFVAPMPPHQSASADGWEASDAEWWAPRAALDAWTAGRMTLIEPTLRTLELLVDFDSVDAALGAIDHGQSRPDRIGEPGGGERIMFPHDSPDGLAVPEPGRP